MAAIGKADFVQGEWLKPGAVVIDVGINYVPGMQPYLKSGAYIDIFKMHPRKVGNDWSETFTTHLPPPWLHISPQYPAA